MHGKPFKKPVDSGCSSPYLVCLKIVTAFTLAISFATVAAATLRLCNDPLNGIPPDKMPWLPNGASQNACELTAIFSALQITNAYDSPTKVAAFKDEKLYGLRESSIRTGSPRLFDPVSWDEHGHAGALGELWWGRQGNSHLIVGQESFVRLDPLNNFPNPAEMAQLLAEARRQMEAIKNKKPANPMLAVDHSGLFPAASLEYRYVGGTATTFAGGLGGDGQIPPGRAVQATLTLNSVPSVTGILTLVIDVDGGARTFTIPLMSNIDKRANVSDFKPEERYRLRAAQSVGEKYVRCEDSPDLNPLASSQICDFTKRPTGISYAPATESYEAYGAFFGDHAQFAAIFYGLTINSHTRNRHGAGATGVVVLERK